MIAPSTMLELLRLQLEAGADCALLDAPLDRFALPVVSPSRPQPRQAAAADSPPPPAAGSAAPLPPRRPAITVTADALASPAQAEDAARRLAGTCGNLEELRQALLAFDGCALKSTATQLVFADGNPQAPIMLVGEAPGRDEDRIGRPFVGESGRLLDRMLAAIGLDRSGVYITNIVPWRPPGNRKPSQAETTACTPFIRRHIELIAPRLLILLGGIALTTLLQDDARITRQHGRWFTYADAGGPIPTMALFHPAYLLRRPEEKRETWRDLLAIQQKIREFA